MSDKKRMRHLFNLLILTQERVETEKMWDEFKKLYHPTDDEVSELQAVYKAYYESEVLM